MSSVLTIIRHYQGSIEKNPEDEKRVLRCLDKLYQLDVTVPHLQETGVGRTVNALRKEPGHVGTAARAVVAKWKLMVAKEEETLSNEEVQQRESSHDEDNDDSGDSDDSSKGLASPKKEFSIPEHSSMPMDISAAIKQEGQKRSYSDEEFQDSNKNYKKQKLQESPQYSYSSSENHQRIEVKPEPNVSSSEGSNPSKMRHSSDRPSKEKTEKWNHESSKQNKYDVDIFKTEQTVTSSSNNSSKHKSDEHKENKLEKNSHSLKNKHEKSRNDERKERKSEDKASDKHKTKDKTREEISKASEHKDRSREHKDRSSEHKDRSSEHKDRSREHKDKSSEHKDRSSEHKDRSSEHKDRSSIHKDRSRSAQKDETKKVKESEHRSSKRTSDGSTSDKVKKMGDSSHKSDKGAEMSHKSDKDKRSSKSSHTEEKPKKKRDKASDEKVDDEGIGCNSGTSFTEGLGTSFAEALGMLSPAKPKKKLVKETFTAPSLDRDIETSPQTLLSPNAKLPQLPHLEITALPEISPNYKPRPPPKLLPGLTDDEALSQVMTTKNQRTKVYSGTKRFGAIPTLNELCIRVLQENIDALEYTGGVPYDILKPIVDMSSPEQLFTLEHFNPYLMEDTDHLWKAHCEITFRREKRQEMETWREMYLRCQEEREEKLKSLTKNIKLTQVERNAPIKQTKMAYVDTVVKPPRSVARKQALHGTARVAVVSPAARVATLAGSNNVFRAPESAALAPTRSIAMPFSSGSQKPKKAPLMMKTLQFMRGKKR